MASSDHPERVMDHFVRAPGVVEVLVRGPTKTSVRTSAGLQVDLRVVSDDQFACALAYFTGSKEHNIALRTIAQRKGFKVSEYGVWRDGRPWIWTGRAAGAPRSAASPSRSIRTPIRRRRSRTSITESARRGAAGWKRGTC
ncbi:MAG: hypothetical protein ACK44W_13630 [Planctomycetota bacterium]